MNDAERILKDGDEVPPITFNVPAGTPMLTISLEILNTYEFYSSVTTKVTNHQVPVPENFDDLDDWSWEFIYEFTGVGYPEGDSWYDVTVTACSDPRLVGREFEFGY